MKQVKQIIEFILVVTSCFFRKRKQQKVHPHVPEDPYPPGSCNGRKGDCPGCSGCNCNPQSAQATGQSGERCLPVVVPRQGNTSASNSSEESNNSANGASKLLGWCLIAVAGTSYLYKLLV